MFYKWSGTVTKDMRNRWIHNYIYDVYEGMQRRQVF